MSDLSNITRPYAQAIFELAQEQGDLPGWEKVLDFLAAVVKDKSIQSFISDPHVSSEQLQQLIIDICDTNIGPNVVNLVKLLVRNSRISMLPEIARSYMELQAKAERIIEVDVTTASQIDETQQQKFIEALQTRLGHIVKLEFDVDKDLIGGAVIRAGDQVIDGSVKAQLEQLVNAICA